MEEAANRAIRSDLNVSATYMPLAKAREIGALALFGETYDEEVRVVEMGGPWSRELCGGTHVQHTSQIGLVTLTGESSVGAGVRRVEAFVGIEAFRFLAKERALVLGLTELLKVQPDQLPDRVSKLVSQLKAAEKQIADLKSRAALADVGAIVAGRQDLSGVGYIAHQANGLDRQRPPQPGAGGSQPGRRHARRWSRWSAAPADKPAVVIVTTQGARDRGLKAGDLVRTASETLGGRGGGKDDIAQGGGTDGSRGPDALKSVEDAISHTLQS